MKKVFDNISYWVLRLWYTIVIVASTIYVFKNFDTIRDFTFFCDFDGDNLIFVLWLILLVFPIFDSFEDFGNNNKRRKQEEAEKLNQEVVQKAKDASSPSEVMDIEQLKAYLKKMEGKSDE